MSSKQEKFKKLLKNIFQYSKDKIDLDFGVYRVFKHKEDEIRSFIETKLPEFIEQNLDRLEPVTIYNHTLEFFERYFQDGDFYPIPIYSTTKNHILRHNGEEVIFSWANKDQYYIKSIDNFSIYKIKHDKLYDDSFYNTNTQAVNFVINEIDDTKGNNKSTRIFTLSSKEAEFLENEGFNIYLDYKNKSADIVEIDENKLFEITQNAKINLTFEETAHHLKKFKNIRKTDFFIHKRLETFLKEELDYYLKTNVLRNISILSDTDIKTTQIVKKVGEFIIKFIASLEELQKMLWEKKKFAYDVNYIITLDKLSMELLKEIINHPNFTHQIEEWRELKLINGFNKDELYEKASLKKEYRYLPLDTKHFDEELKYKILESIENLDEVTDGVLINSDNFHGLNFLQNRYREKVKCVYIDPPYNTGDNQFAYKDNYQHSSWLSMMNDRISLMQKLVNKDGRFYCSIDDRENNRLLNLLFELLKEENYLGSISWEKRTKSQNTQTAKYMLQSKIEYIHPFRFNGERQEFNLEVSGQKEYPLVDANGKNYRVQRAEQDSLDRPHAALSMVYPILGVSPANGKCWKFGIDTKNYWEENDRIFLQDGWPYIIFRPEDEEQDKHKPFWSHFFDKELYGTAEKGLDLLDKKMGFGKDFQTVKPIELIYKLFFHSTNSDDIVMDFFGGSGTSIHSVLNLNRNNNENRKYISMETNEYFTDLLCPRVKKAIFTDNWKDGEPQDTNGISQLVKYCRLEQYEDTLENSKLQSSTDTQCYINALEPLKEHMNELYASKYLSLYKDFTARESKALLMDDTIFFRPFDFTMKVNIDSQMVEKKMDLVETFNTLKGIEVQSIKLRYLDDKKYIFVDGKNEVVIWREFDEESLDIKKELVFINDNCNTKKELYINGITQTHTKKELVAKESVFELRALLVEGVKIDE